MSRKCLFFGEPTGDRTQDLRIKSPVLYQLSYRLYSVLYLQKNRRFVHPSQDFGPWLDPLLVGAVREPPLRTRRVTSVSHITSGRAGGLNR